MAKKKAKKAKMKIPKMVHLSQANIALIVKAVTKSRHLNQPEKNQLLPLLAALKD